MCTGDHDMPLLSRLQAHTTLVITESHGRTRFIQEAWTEITLTKSLLQFREVFVRFLCVLHQLRQQQLVARDPLQGKTASAG